MSQNILDLIKVEKFIGGHIVGKIEVHNRKGQRLRFNGRESWTTKIKAMQSIEAEGWYISNLSTEIEEFRKQYSAGNIPKTDWNKIFDQLMEKCINELFSQGHLVWVENK